ncbi:hypothetical protein JTE90_003200 [Oedothorax gibbosus]|uniref:Uncharacterized protein n=1 Tax=Oedothorax gibbosus TaxID=931172 RepID=A0AAV6TJ07_9ARAC|nr:hypothetical protein JTE90_003200 [Oedothorax gibbosus]
MDKLKTDKRYLKASLTKLKGTLESKEFGIDSAEVTLYTNKVADLESKCSDIFSKIYYDCQEEEIDGYISESQDIQDIIDGYKLIVLRARDRLELENTEAKKVVPRETKQSSGGLNLSLKLPEFNIPSFSGSSNLEWLSFRDLFSASVVKNQNLSDAQRLQYLVGSVKDDALRVIQSSLPITDSNFQIALDLLEERYSNKRQLVFTLIRQIFDIPQCTREDASQLLSIVDTSKEVIRSLQNLDIPLTGFADSIFVYSLIQKLDPATRSWWERGLEDDRIPTIDELLKFITHHARTIQHQSYKIFSKPCQPSVPGSGKPCSKFKDLTTLQRQTFVKENRLCYNCLKNHKLANCSSKFTYRVCHKKHNTLLHFESTNSTDNARVLSPHAAEFVPSSINEPTPVPQQTLTNVSSCVSHQSASIQVLLCTAIVKVLDSSNQFQHCRVLLDPG